MAGKDIYIGSMLEKLQDSMTELEKNTIENATKQVEKLSEVSALLSSIAANTGIQLLQEGFTGAAFSALTLKSHRFINVTPTGSVPNSSGELSATVKNGGTTGKADIVVDLTNVTTFTFNVRSDNAAGNHKGLVYIDGVEVYSLQQPPTAGTDVSIDVTEYSGVHTISFTGVVYTSGYTRTFYYRNIMFDDKAWFAPCDNLAFSDNQLKMATNDYGYAYGFIHVTDSITGTVNVWSQLITNGLIKNVKFAIVDEKGNEILPLYSTKINEISSIPVYDFYIKFEFTAPDDYVSGVIFRYS